VCLLRGTDWVLKYNSTFCPHCVFMCFVWISEQTAIISLYSINWLVFITETYSVYCAVRTESLTVIQVNLSVLAVPWLRLQAASLSLRRAGCDPRSVHVTCVVDRGFSEYAGFTQCILFQQCCVLVSIYLSLLPEGQTGEAWEPSKKQWSF
jgi:hypothetical protein